jgi:hypothetical protein
MSPLIGAAGVGVALMGGSVDGPSPSLSAAGLPAGLPLAAGLVVWAAGL